MRTTHDDTAQFNASADALGSALQAFDPHVVDRARAMVTRVREALVAFRAAARIAEDGATPAQRALLEARLVPLTRQARSKYATLAALTPADP